LVKQDFIRHIVNPVLSELLKHRNELVSVVDEIRRFLANAESKYGFSIYGENPVKLCEYLGSNDFKILVNLFKSVNALDALIEILRRTRRSYRDFEEIHKCVDRVLRNIKKEYLRENREDSEEHA